MGRAVCVRCAYNSTDCNEVEFQHPKVHVLRVSGHPDAREQSTIAAQPRGPCLFHSDQSCA